MNRRRTRVTELKRRHGVALFLPLPAARVRSSAPLGKRCNSLSCLRQPRFLARSRAAPFQPSTLLRTSKSSPVFPAVRLNGPSSDSHSKQQTRFLPLTGLVILCLALSQAFIEPCLSTTRTHLKPGIVCSHLRPYRPDRRSIFRPIARFCNRPFSFELPSLHRPWATNPPPTPGYSANSLLFLCAAGPRRSHILSQMRQQQTLLATMDLPPLPFADLV